MALIFQGLFIAVTTLVDDVGPAFFSQLSNLILKALEHSIIKCKRTRNLLF